MAAGWPFGHSHGQREPAADSRRGAAGLGNQAWAGTSTTTPRPKPAGYKYDLDKSRQALCHFAQKPGEQQSLPEQSAVADGPEDGCEDRGSLPIATESSRRLSDDTLHHALSPSKS